MRWSGWLPASGRPWGCALVASPPAELQPIGSSEGALLQIKTAYWIAAGLKSRIEMPEQPESDNPQAGGIAPGSSAGNAARHGCPTSSRDIWQRTSIGLPRDPVSILLPPERSYYACVAHFALKLTRSCFHLLHCARHREASRSDRRSSGGLPGIAGIWNVASRQR